jgi:hypothetical protein
LWTELELHNEVVDSFREWGNEEYLYDQPKIEDYYEGWDNISHLVDESDDEEIDPLELLDRPVDAVRLYTMKYRDISYHLGDEEGGNKDAILERFIDDGEAVFPVDVNYGNPSGDTWGAKLDGSLEASEGGVELISPVLTLDEAIESYKLMADYINNDGNVAEETGFHVNISYKGALLKDADMFKAFLFMDEGEISKFFPDRENNRYAEYIRAQLLGAKIDKADVGEAAKMLKKQNKKVVNNLDKVMKSMNLGKFKAINLLNIDSGSASRVEFRYLGGPRYVKDQKKVINMILKFCFLIKLAVDPEFKKKEYLQRLGRLYGRTQKMLDQADITVHGKLIGQDLGSEQDYYLLKDGKTVAELDKGGKLLRKITKQAFDIMAKRNKDIHKV